MVFLISNELAEGEQNTLNVMVIGGGGREHALALHLNKSRHVGRILCVPGNAGTAQIGENFDLPVSDFASLARLAHEHDVDLTVVGPEAPLCDGIVDHFEAEGLRIFGPSKAAARIEGDKAYAKQLMKSAHIPAPEGRSFDHFEEARTFIASREAGVVIKASGLAAGKGVFVCSDPADALVALEKIMVAREFGEAGDSVVVEELVKGQELSVLALVDDRTIYVLEPAQDHKQFGDGDVGPNTGGMGAYSPAPIATPELLDTIQREVFVPIVDALRREGAPYRGVLYAGLMLTPGGPKVLEFNCRFGDPETQVVLPRLESDLYEMLSAVVDGKLIDLDLRWTPKTAVGVVMAAGGYPGVYEKGKTIEGLSDLQGQEDVFVYQAGTKQIEHVTVTNGGRVLCVTGIGDDVASAQRRAYEAVDTIKFDSAYCRRDIGNKAIARPV